jgi:uncharacterized membrane protein YqgA involved in biofilm formation
MSASIDDQSILVRIRRDIAESEKLMAERDKLFREGQKLQTDRLLAPFIALGGLLVAALGLAVAFLKH